MIVQSPKLKLSKGFWSANTSELQHNSQIFTINSYLLSLIIDRFPKIPSEIKKIYFIIRENYLWYMFFSVWLRIASNSSVSKSYWKIFLLVEILRLQQCDIRGPPPPHNLAVVIFPYVRPHFVWRINLIWQASSVFLKLWPMFYFKNIIFVLTVILSTFQLK